MMNWRRVPWLGRLTSMLLLTLINVWLAILAHRQAVEVRLDLLRVSTLAHFCGADKPAE